VTLLNPRRLIGKLPQILAVLAAATFGLMFFVTIAPRVGYRYDLDFDEDSILMESLRMAQGQPVYIAPNAVFNPHVYMPLFFWLSAAVIKVTGPSLPPLRAISVASTLATAALLYAVARRESGRRWLGLVCAGLFLGGYRINGFWYDVVRVDALFVALLLGGLALGIYAGRSRPRLLLAAGVLSLSFLTKQTGLAVGLGLGVYLLAALGRRAWWFILPLLVLSLAPIFALNAATGGWFFYHVFKIGSADPIEFARGVSFVLFDVFGVMLALTLLTLLTAVLELRRAGLQAWRTQPWLWAIVMALAISGLGRIRVGGNLNDRLPAYALLCLAPALLARAVVGQPEPWATPTSPLARWAPWALTGAIVLQFGLGIYNPLRYMPTAQMRRAGDSLVARIAAVPGPVLVMMHPYYALLAGKEPSTQIATLWYVRDRGALPMPSDFENRIETHYYAAIITDQSDFEFEPAMHGLLNSYYVQAAALGPTEAPPTLVGVVVVPELIYRPRPK
jgi:4-amino-4-deoxy-L-arabinose transferase-like glycosyltransferase